MKIAVFSVHEFERPYIESANTNGHKLAFTKKKLSAESVEFAEGCKTALLFSSDDASASVLEELKKLGVELIVSRSAGVDHIDLEAAEDLELTVANVPSYSPNAIAEHCIALVLALFRKLEPSIARISNYNFSLEGQVGIEINQKKFGICGTGEIGEALAYIANGFGAEVLLFDNGKNENLKDEEWCTYVEKEELLQKADIISLNLPLTPETDNFISKDELKMIKKSAVLINTGRGGLVDTKAVKAALENNRLAGFGMDVYENEKGIFYKDLSDEDKRDELLLSLINMPQVIVTAHQAFLTDTALTNMMATVFKSVDQFDAGESVELAIENH